MEAVDVILAGRVLPGTDPNQAAADFARISGADVKTVHAVITSNQPRLAMQGLTPEHARAWLTRMTAVGIEASLRASSKPADTSFGPPPETPTQQQAQPQSQPQATPQPPSAGVGSGRWLDRARKVPVGHGWTWIRDSWRLVRERPGTWIAVLLMLGGFILMSGWIKVGILQVVPKDLFTSWGEFGTLLRGVLGVAARNFFYMVPLFLGGIALMAHRQLAGEEIRFADLMDCCKGEGAGRLYALCGCAVLYALGVVVVSLVLTKGLYYVGAAWDVTWLPLLLLIGTTAPTLCALSGTQAPAAILKGIGGAFRNWRAWSLYIGFIFGCFVLIGLVSNLVRGPAGNVVGKILGTFFVCGVLFLLSLPGYMATRDMFYEE